MNLGLLRLQSEYYLRSKKLKAVQVAGAKKVFQQKLQLNRAA